MSLATDNNVRVLCGIRKLENFFRYCVPQLAGAEHRPAESAFVDFYLKNMVAIGSAEVSWRAVCHDNAFGLSERTAILNEDWLAVLIGLSIFVPARALAHVDLIGWVPWPGARSGFELSLGLVLLAVLAAINHLFPAAH